MLPYFVTRLSSNVEENNFKLNLITWQGGRIVVYDWFRRRCSSPGRSLRNEWTSEHLWIQEKPLSLIRWGWTTCKFNFILHFINLVDNLLIDNEIFLFDCIRYIKNYNLFNLRTLRHHLKLLLSLRGVRKCRWFVLQSFSHGRGRNTFIGLALLKRRRRGRIINNRKFN